MSMCPKHRCWAEQVGLDEEIDILSQCAGGVSVVRQSLTELIGSRCDCCFTRMCCKCVLQVLFCKSVCVASVGAFVVVSLFTW